MAESTVNVITQFQLAGRQEYLSELEAMKGEIAQQVASFKDLEIVLPVRLGKDELSGPIDALIESIEASREVVIPVRMGNAQGGVPAGAPQSSGDTIIPPAPGSNTPATIVPGAAGVQIASSPDEQETLSEMLNARRTRGIVESDSTGAIAQQQAQYDQLTSEEQLHSELTNASVQSEMAAQSAAEQARREAVLEAQQAQYDAIGEGIRNRAFSQAHYQNRAEQDVIEGVQGEVETVDPNLISSYGGGDVVSPPGEGAEIEGAEVGAGGRMGMGGMFFLLHTLLHGGEAVATGMQGFGGYTQSGEDSDDVQSIKDRIAADKDATSAAHEGNLASFGAAYLLSKTFGAISPSADFEGIADQNLEHDDRQLKAAEQAEKAQDRIRRMRAEAERDAEQTDSEMRRFDAEQTSGESGEKREVVDQEYEKRQREASLITNSDARQKMLTDAAVVKADKDEAIDSDSLKAYGTFKNETAEAQDRLSGNTQDAEKRAFDVQQAQAREAVVKKFGPNDEAVGAYDEKATADKAEFDKKQADDREKLEQEHQQRLSDIQAQAHETQLRASGDTYEADRDAFIHAGDERVAKLREIAAATEDAAQKTRLLAEADAEAAKNTSALSARDAAYQRDRTFQNTEAVEHAATAELGAQGDVGAMQASEQQDKINDSINAITKDKYPGDSSWSVMSIADSTQGTPGTQAFQDSLRHRLGQDFGNLDPESLDKLTKSAESGVVSNQSRATQVQHQAQALRLDELRTAANASGDEGLKKSADYEALRESLIRESDEAAPENKRLADQDERAKIAAFQKQISSGGWQGQSSSTSSNVITENMIHSSQIGGGAYMALNDKMKHDMHELARGHDLTSDLFTKAAPDPVITQLATELKSQLDTFMKSIKTLNLTAIKVN